MSDNAPLIIGGIGGSGTKVTAMICEKLGYNFGPAHLMNPFYDKMCLESFGYKNLDRALFQDFDESMKLSFLESLKSFGINDFNQRWAFKNGLNMFYILLFNYIFPYMKYIHVIRDGRDMLFSKNQNYPRRAYPYIFDGIWNENNAKQIIAIFWNNGNLMVDEIAQELLNKNYLCVRLEDICNEPKDTIFEIADFLEVKVISLSDVMSCIEYPDSLGRWKQHLEDVKKSIWLMKEGLRYFNYLEE